MIQNRTKSQLEGELAEAAFQRAADDVARIAQQSGTPILTWNDEDELDSPEANAKDEAAPQDDRR